MNPFDLKTRDARVLETTLPAMLMLKMLEKARKTGVEMRWDVEKKLSNAVLAPLGKLDTVSVSRIAHRLEDMSTTMLRDVSADSAAHGIYVCAMFTLLLVAEDRLDDKGNMAVLVALMIMDDIKHDEPDTNGMRPMFAAQETVWRKEADAMLFRANIMGIYPAKRLQLIAS